MGSLHSIRGAGETAEAVSGAGSVIDEARSVQKCLQLLSSLEGCT